MCVSMGMPSAPACTPTDPYSTSQTLALGGRREDGLPWVLPEGTYQVRAWFKNGAGLVAASPPYSMTLDYSPPASGASFSADRGATYMVLSWSPASDPETGVASYTVVYARGETPPSSCSSGTQVAVQQGALSVRVGGLRRFTWYSFRVCATNRAGLRNGGITLTKRTLAVKLK